jgi:hypothetical protein
VALGVEEYGYARNQRWEAGMAQQLSSGYYPDQRSVLSDEEAIGLFTWNLADLFGLQKVPHTLWQETQIPHLSFQSGAWNATLDAQATPGRIVKGARADFVAFNGSPLQQTSAITLIAQSDSIWCYPKQEGFEMVA